MTTTQDTDALVKRLLALANCEANELADALTEAATMLDRLTDINRDALGNINTLTDAKNAEIDQLRGERDALQAKLDNAAYEAAHGIGAKP